MVWCGVVWWCGVVCCVVLWCGVVWWCGVMWCTVSIFPPACFRLVSKIYIFLLPGGRYVLELSQRLKGWSNL